MRVWHVLHALSTCDAIFVVGGVILRLTVLTGSPVIPNRLPNQTSRLCSDRTSGINVDRHCVLYICFPQSLCVEINLVNIFTLSILSTEL